MRWNCPHCGVSLGLADEKMSANWSFSKCFQCGGYALVRKSEVNLIKVDRAPAGEKVILPEASEQPLLSQEASQRMARYTDKSVVKPAVARKPLGSAMAIPQRPAAFRPATPTLAASASKSTPPPTQAAGAALMNSTEAHTPNPPPAAFEEKPRTPPVSGPNAPAGASLDRSMPPGLAYLNGVNGAGLFPEPLPDVPQPKRSRSAWIPGMIGVVAALGVASALFSFMQGPNETTATPASKAELSSSQEASDTEAQAPPPVRALNRPETIQQAPQPATVKAAPISDQIRSQAMAPARQVIPTAPKAVQLSPENPPLVVQPRVQNTHLRSGPGMTYPVVGTINSGERYIVTDWNDRWFRVLPQVSSEGKDDELTGWVRTDAVQVVPVPVLAE